MNHDDLVAALAALPARERWAVFLAALDAVDHQVRVEIGGAVVSKNRALRFGTNGTYRSDASRTYQEWAAWSAVQAMRGRSPLDGYLATVLTVRAPNRKGLVDADNAPKAPLDGFNGVAFRDDRQIDLLLVRRVVEPHQPPSLTAYLDEIA